MNSNIKYHNYLKIETKNEENIYKIYNLFKYFASNYEIKYFETIIAEFNKNGTLIIDYNKLCIIYTYISKFLPLGLLKILEKNNELKIILHFAIENSKNNIIKYTGGSYIDGTTIYYTTEYTNEYKIIFKNFFNFEIDTKYDLTYVNDDNKIYLKNNYVEEYPVQFFHMYFLHFEILMNNEHIKVIKNLKDKYLKNYNFITKTNKEKFTFFIKQEINDTINHLIYPTILLQDYEINLINILTNAYLYNLVNENVDNSRFIYKFSLFEIQEDILTILYKTINVFIKDNHKKIIDINLYYFNKSLDKYGIINIKHIEFKDLKDKDIPKKYLEIFDKFL